LAIQEVHSFNSSTDQHIANLGRICSFGWYQNAILFCKRNT